MSQTIRAHYPVPPLSFDENSYRIIARQVQEDFVAIGLLAGLYGRGHLRLCSDAVC